MALLHTGLTGIVKIARRCKSLATETGTAASAARASRGLGQIWRRLCLQERQELGLGGRPS